MMQHVACVALLIVFIAALKSGGHAPNTQPNLDLPPTAALCIAQMTLILVPDEVGS